MRDNSPWCVSCGWWHGVRVQVHASLVVVFVLAMYLAAQTARMRGLDDGWLYGLMGSAALLIGIVLHEAGHVLVAWRLGGSVDVIVLGPFGGLHAHHVPREPHREVTVALAGPLLNLVAMAALGPALLIGRVNLGDILLHPFYPAGLLTGSLWIVSLKMAFWVNWLLLLVNLIPAPSLDGGRALRSVLWPVMGYRGAVRTVSRCGMLIALLLCLLALLSHDPRDSRLVPTWFPLVMLAIYLFFASRQELHAAEEDDVEGDLFGYDFSQGYTSLEQAARSPRPRKPGPLQRWLQQRREMKERRLREIEEDEERRVDEILVRVKQGGINSISPEERGLLNRVSARYRNRLQS